MGGDTDLGTLRPITIHWRTTVSCRAGCTGKIAKCPLATTGLKIREGGKSGAPGFRLVQVKRLISSCLSLGKRMQENASKVGSFISMLVTFAGRFGISKIWECYGTAEDINILQGNCKSGRTLGRPNEKG